MSSSIDNSALRTDSWGGSFIHSTHKPTTKVNPQSIHATESTPTLASPPPSQKLSIDEIEIPLTEPQEEKINQEELLNIIHSGQFSSLFPKDTANAINENIVTVIKKLPDNDLFELLECSIRSATFAQNAEKEAPMRLKFVLQLLEEISMREKMHLAQIHYGNQDRFSYLVDLMLKDPYEQSSRQKLNSISLTNLYEKSPEIIIKFLKKAYAETKDNTNPVARLIPSLIDQLNSTNYKQSIPFLRALIDPKGVNVKELNTFLKDKTTTNIILQNTVARTLLRNHGIDILAALSGTKLTTEPAANMHSFNYLRQQAA